MHHGGDQRQEAKQRLAIAHQTFTQQRKLLFCNPALSLKVRTQIFDSIVCSALTYGSESWCFSTLADKHHIHVGIIKLYKRLLRRRPHDDQLTDDEICNALRLPTPTEILRRARLRYLGTLFHCGVHAGWGLLSMDGPWKQLLQDDLHWMWQQLCRSSDLCDPSQSFAKWLYIIQYHRGFWKRLVNRAIAHAVQQRHNRLIVTKIYQRAFVCLQTQGLLALEEPSYHREDHGLGVFGCMSCGLRCRTKGGEGAHFFRCHGRINPLRRLFDDTWCPCCRKEFHTLTKMQLHLRNVSRCRRDLWARGHFFPIRPGIGSCALRAGDREHDGALPPQQTSGAIMQPVQPRDLRPESTDLIVLIVDSLADRDHTSTLEVVL